METMTPSDDRQGQARKITPTDRPVFPCWLWSGDWWHCNNRTQFIYDAQYYSSTTHWHPDQPTPPSEQPGDDIRRELTKNFKPLAPSTPSPGALTGDGGRPGDWIDKAIDRLDAHLRLAGYGITEPMRATFKSVIYEHAPTSQPGAREQQGDKELTDELFLALGDRHKVGRVKEIFRRHLPVSPARESDGNEAALRAALKMVVEKTVVERDGIIGNTVIGVSGHALEVNEAQQCVDALATLPPAKEEKP